MMTAVDSARQNGGSPRCPKCPGTVVNKRSLREDGEVAKMIKLAVKIENAVFAMTNAEEPKVIRETPSDADQQRATSSIEDVTMAAEDQDACLTVTECEKDKPVKTEKAIEKKKEDDKTKTGKEKPRLAEEASRKSEKDVAKSSKLARKKRPSSEGKASTSANVCFSLKGTMTPNTKTKTKSAASTRLVVSPFYQLGRLCPRGQPARESYPDFFEILARHTRPEDEHHEDLLDDVTPLADEDKTKRKKNRKTQTPEEKASDTEAPKKKRKKSKGGESVLDKPRETKSSGASKSDEKPEKKSKCEIALDDKSKEPKEKKRKKRDKTPAFEPYSVNSTDSASQNDKTYRNISGLASAFSRDTMSPPHSPQDLPSLDCSQTPVKRRKTRIPSSNDEDDGTRSKWKRMISSDSIEEEPLKEEEDECISEVASQNEVLKAIENVDKSSATPTKSDDEDMFASTPQAKKARRKKRLSGRKVKKTFSEEKFILVTTGIKEEEDLRAVQEFAQVLVKGRAQLKAEIDEDVTHLVAKAYKGRRADRTLKYLQGVARGKRVVNFKWVKDSLKDNDVKRWEDYEALDSGGEPGPERARLAERPLFHGLQFCLQGRFGCINSMELKRLLAAAGGKVARNVTNFDFSQDTLCRMVLRDKDTDEGARNPSACLAVALSADAVVLDKDWVIESLGAYRLRSIRSHLLHGPDEEFLKRIMAHSGLEASLLAVEDESQVVQESESEEDDTILV